MTEKGHEMAEIQDSVNHEGAESLTPLTLEGYDVWADDGFWVEAPHPHDALNAGGDACWRTSGRGYDELVIETSAGILTFPLGHHGGYEAEVTHSADGVFISLVGESDRLLFEIH